MPSEASLNLGSVPPIRPDPSPSQRDQVLDEGVCWLRECNQEISVGFMVPNGVPNVLCAFH